MNVPELEGNEAVQSIVQIEAYVSMGAYGAAEQALDNVYYPEPHIRQRAADIHMIVWLRLKPQRNAKEAIQYFTTRSKYEPKNVKFKMWLAEAYAANRQSKEALELLTDLDKRDLIRLELYPPNPVGRICRTAIGLARASCTLASRVIPGGPAA